MAEKGLRGRPQTEITIAWATLLKIAAACLLAYLAFRLQLLVGILFIALLIAITLSPIVIWSVRRGWPKWVGVLISSTLMLAFVALFLGVLIPSLTNQGDRLVKNLPILKEHLLHRLPESGPMRDSINKILNSSSFSNPEPLLKQMFAWGKVAVQSLIEFGFVLIIAIYLLVDGERVYKWLLAFLSDVQREKMERAAPEIAQVVFSYMAGQVITSVLCAIYVFALLTILHVPDALLLAVLAGIFDILPIIGFFLSVIPALILALTVSPTAALLVALLYTLYHWVETYFIVPKVYGNRLRLSTLTVLISCMAAGLVAGVVGVIAVLPIVASYPIIEKIWLRPHLEADTVSKHAKIDANPP
jgi:predicted PurR-regulated permease PerM